MKVINLCIYLLLACSFSYGQKNSSQKTLLDSINFLRNASHSNEIDPIKRFQFGELAIELAKELNIDSTKLRSYRSLSNLYLDFDKTKEFGEINKTRLELGRELKDSLELGYAHGNLGYYYLIASQNDSAYYHYYNAEKIYAGIGNIQGQVNSIFSLANIQETERDYVGSESNAVKALKLIEPLPRNEDVIETLSLIHDLLATNSQRLGNYDDAIDYYNKSIESTRGSSLELYVTINGKNSIGYTHFKKGELNKALDLYQEIKEYPKLLEIDTSLYILVSGNIALTRYKLGSYPADEIENLFKEGYELSQTTKNPFDLLYVGGYMAEYYHEKGEFANARKYAHESLAAAREVNANDHILRLLDLLSKLEDGETGKEYLYQRIKLSDSLLQKERSIRNKFAKIEFETDQILAEKEQLSKERLVFLASSIGLLVLLILIYIIITQRSKNKELRFAQQQQEANEEIYNLMLAQQDKVEEGRTHEKKRISQELHDGILGRLFGTRLSLDSLNLVKTDDAMKSRMQYIHELKNIEQEIRKISHDLNTDFVSGSSFNDIIGSLVETQTKVYSLKHTLEVGESINWDKVSNKKKMHVYRMLQECMQNIYKHAEANYVGVSFSLKNDVILMQITDDGKGFNTNKSRKGIGIKNINSRLKEINGEVEITSEIGKGTSIEIEFPV